MKKKIFLSILIAFFLVFFTFLYYKKIYNGNNINNQIDIAEKFLNNTNSYLAEIEVTVNSNKNNNKYIIKQEENGNKSKLEIIKGEDIQGLKLEIDNEILKVTNTKLNLEKIYENYNIISNNGLFLSTFIQECKDEKNIKQINNNEEQIILELEIEGKKYIKYKQLYLDKKTKKPIKMLIYNSYNKLITSIIYTNIEIN